MLCIILYVGYYVCCVFLCVNYMFSIYALSVGNEPNKRKQSSYRRQNRRDRSLALWRSNNLALCDDFREAGARFMWVNKAALDDATTYATYSA